MRSLILLALLAASPYPARAGDAAPPSPELIKLEKTLTRKKEERTQGVVTAEQYQAFLTEFRPDLAITMERIPPIPANAASHARILVLLGDHAAAVQGLNKALEENPGNNTLTLALGQTYYEKADYAAALATAEEVLKHDPKNDAALFLKHSSEGRGAPVGQAHEGTAAAFQTPAAAKPQATRTGVEFTAPGKKKTAVDVPASSSENSESKGGNSMPLWPLAVPLGAGLIGYGVLKSRGAWSEQEAVDPGPGPTPEEIERNRKHLKVATAAVVIGFGIVYGLPLIMTAAPVAAAYLRTGGNGSLHRIAASEAGAVGPMTQGAMRTSTALLPELSAAESQIVGEAQVILRSPQFAQLRAAYQSGQPAAINIGGRLIQYEPQLPASGMTLFQEKGFVMGREAFTSQLEAQRTILHELYRLHASAAAGGMTGSLASQETKAAYDFADKAVKVLNK
jgi:tetratricopeptide (TPR) repeat protein